MGGVIHMLEETMVKVGCDHPRRPKRKKEIAMRIEKMRMSTNMLSTRGSRMVVLRGTVRCLLNRTLKMEDIGVGCGRSRKGEGWWMDVFRGWVVGSGLTTSFEESTSSNDGRNFEGADGTNWKIQS